MNRIGVVGGQGQLGRALLRSLGEAGVGWGRHELDVTDSMSVAQKLRLSQVDGVINAAAFTRVDDAEDEIEAAVAINGLGAWNVAQTCHDLNIPLIYLSTDYVFGRDEGRRRPYGESDAAGPINVYGATKLYGEQLVQLAAPRSFVVRTCGLYGTPMTPGTGNFVEAICRKALAGEPLQVVGDQRCTPTSVADLGPALIQLLQTDRYGLHHLTSSGDCTWFEFASAIVAHLGIDVPLTQVTSQEFVRRAKRPAYSVLDCSGIASQCGLTLPHWAESVAHYLSDRAIGLKGRPSSAPRGYSQGESDMGSGGTA
ncbi:MAG: dTDP-4-dehydrorhamnose reductase [Planctomycetaceae bacterium]